MYIHAVKFWAWPQLRFGIGQTDDGMASKEIGPSYGQAVGLAGWLACWLIDGLIMAGLLNSLPPLFMPHKYIYIYIPPNLKACQGQFVDQKVATHPL